MSDPATISILITGLDFSWTAAHRAGPNVDVARIRAAVAAGLADLAGVPGLATESYLVDPDSASLADDFAAKLRAGHAGRPWSGVVVGWGVRAFDQTTAVFERLVNAVREVSPESRLVFTGPQVGYFEALQRGFPGLRRAE